MCVCVCVYIYPQVVLIAVSSQSKNHGNPLVTVFLSIDRTLIDELGLLLYILLSQM